MENSLNSTSPEPTISGLKSVFNKPADISQAFEVSVNESVTAMPSNSEFNLNTTSSEADKLWPFKKSRKSTQDFNVSLNDSTSDSECEQSVTFIKAEMIFPQKKKSLIDFFNVSYNETNRSVQPDNISKSIDESNNFKKTNPFKKNIPCNEFLIRDESFIQISPDENTSGVCLDKSQRLRSACGIEDEHDSTTFMTKQNPFRNLNRQESSALLEELITEEAENRSRTDSIVNDELDSDILTKSNPFKHKESLGNKNSLSVTEEQSRVSTAENKVSNDSHQTPKNISLDRSISKLTNKSMSYLEQSSINDENLNHWMSDQSDEELPPPRNPSVATNLSHTKEKPPVPDSPTVETNQVSQWEQKLSEIISNAERKSKVAKAIVKSPQKSKSAKKSNLNVEKPVQNVNKYKPPKLIKPAPFATKKLYNYIIKRLEPKYGINTMLESENLVMSICDVVKKVMRRKTDQKRLIQNLKKEMAKAGLIETTMDFYEFVINFLPYSFRVKVVPCLQPVINVVYPPKDRLNPFDKILGLL